MSGDSPGYIAALDIGTTTIRCHIINSYAKPIGSAECTLSLVYPKEGHVEIEPNNLWNNVINIIKEAIRDADVSIIEIKSLSISTQRSTFITWRKDTGIPLHNFITWKDLRAADLINSINSSFSLSVLHWASHLAYMVTRKKKFAVVSEFKFSSNHVSIRLLWVLQNIKEVKEALCENNLLFGTLDTWLVYKFTGGKTYVTDISNASATGLYDPFALDWSFIVKFLKIPPHILPPVVDNDFDYGTTTLDIFGVPLKIGAVLGDQSSAMFGSCCFEDSELKVTLGTGAFLNVNTSIAVHPSLNGIYPLVAWKTSRELVYMSEVSCSDAGSIIQWMLHAELVSSPEVTSQIALSSKDNGGVYFVPAFSGLGPPINDEYAASGFLGIKPTTGKSHMIRAVLESIVYRTALTYQTLKEERPSSYKRIRVDGGVSKNDFICQMLADITDLNVERMSSEMSSLGVALLAGLKCGIWKNKEQLLQLIKPENVFFPTTDKKVKENYRFELARWRKAAERCMSWYGAK